MALWLKQSTAVTVLIGPMLDETDGVTPLTALTVATQISADIYKWSASTGTPSQADLTLAASGTDNDCVHVANGWYSVELTATDTGTLGFLRITFNPTGGVPGWVDFQVVPANVFNAVVGNTDKLYTDAVEVNSSATAAAQLATSATTIVSGTVSEDGAPTYTAANGGGALVFYSDDITDATADTYNGRILYFLTGTLAKQALAITDYELVAATYGKFTCSQATDVPGDDATFIVL